MEIKDLDSLARPVVRGLNFRSVRTKFDAYPMKLTIFTVVVQYEPLNKSEFSS